MTLVLRSIRTDIEALWSVGAEGIDDPNRPVGLIMVEVFRIEDWRVHAVGGCENSAIPIGQLVADCEFCAVTDQRSINRYTGEILKRLDPVQRVVERPGPAYLAGRDNKKFLQHLRRKA